MSSTDALTRAVSTRPTLARVRSLDGVRAIAVSAVVLYHAGVGPIRGGFLGVDVFFVLSGFLITSLLVTELGERDALSFGRFYERRARRLLPALVVMTILVVVFVDRVAPAGSYPTLPGQIVGTLSYVGNWTLIAHHATYFSLGLPPSPLEHTWSLAIEEQFYLVWPLVLFVLWRLTKRRRSLAAICIAGATLFAAVTVVRFGSGASINQLYFSTDTHATTMLLGAALSFVLLARPSGGSLRQRFVAADRGVSALWNVVAIAAWAGVIACFFAVSGTSGLLYRGGFLVFGVVVAVAIGATVLGPSGIAARCLSVGPVVFVGQISYGIYLFHFPLFLWIDHARTGLSGLALLVVRVAATVAVATLSYRIVEQPIRERRLIKGWGGLAGAVAAFVAVGVVTFAVASSATVVPRPDRVAKRNVVRLAPSGTTTRLLLVGDSMAQTLGFGLNDAEARRDHVYVSVVGAQKCSLVPTEIRTKDFYFSPPQRCRWVGRSGQPVRWTKKLRRLSPALSMMLYRLDVADHRLAGRWVAVGDPRYDCVLRRQIVRAAATLAVTGRPVVLLTTPYYSTGEQADGSIWQEDDPRRVDRYNSILRAVAAEHPDVIHVVDLSSMVSPGDSFTRSIGPVVVRWVDGVHFTYAGDAFIYPRLLSALRPIMHAAPSPSAVATLIAASHVATARGCRGP